MYFQYDSQPCTSSRLLLFAGAFSFITPGISLSRGHLETAIVSFKQNIVCVPNVVFWWCISLRDDDLQCSMHRDAQTGVVRASPPPFMSSLCLEIAVVSLLSSKDNISESIMRIFVYFSLLLVLSSSLSAPSNGEGASAYMLWLLVCIPASYRMQEEWKQSTKWL